MVHLYKEIKVHNASTFRDTCKRLVGSHLVYDQVGGVFIAFTFYGKRTGIHCDLFLHWSTERLLHYKGKIQLFSNLN